MSQSDVTSREKTVGRYDALVVALAIVSAVIYWHVAGLSDKFTFGSIKQQRPILAVFGWFTVLFVIHLAALWCGLRSKNTVARAFLIVVAAVVFRGIMLGSEPIQEVDIYRYLWDGIASTTGVSPYKYTPEEAILARDRTDLPDDLIELARAGNSTDAIRQILDRVHFRQIPTVYPPVSQWGFSFVERLTPHEATLNQRLARMRLWLVVCDLATLLFVLAILHATGLHAAYAMLYGWSPLVIKEIANSGHLDSMAIVLTTAGIYGCVRMMRHAENGAALLDSLVAAVGLALGIGAKIYPVVLLPWFAAITLRRLRWAAILPVATVVLLAASVLRPMFVVPAHARESTLRPPSDGIKTFFDHWEMNDFLFLIVVENLRPDEEQKITPWFVVTPNSARTWFAKTLAKLTKTPQGEATFLAARIIAGAMFGMICLSVCFVAWKANSPTAWLRAAFLTLAWFWLLCPTQNPWYWLWAMPLLPFARCRAWYLVGGLVVVYYLRFWLEYHYPGVAIGGTPYRGTEFFDFAISWLEFFPWLLLLLAESLYLRRSERTPPTCDQSPG